MRQLYFLDTLIAGGTLLLGVVGCDRAPEGGKPDAAKSAAPVDRVAVGTPERTTLTLYTTQPGRIAAFEETPLYSKLSGYVKEVAVDIGDAVAVGDVLVRLSVPELQDELRQKQALVEQAKAEVDQAEAARETAESKVAQAEAGVTRADAEYRRWEAESGRMTELASTGSVTRKLADETLNQYRAAEAARQEATAAVDAARALVRQAESDIAAAEARQKVAEANAAHTRTLAGYTEIKAPYAGVVTRRNVDTGHFVQPATGSGAEPLLVVASIDRVRVFVDVPETDAALVDTGDPAAVTVQALRGRTIDGEVTRTSWSLDAANRSLRAEVDIDNPGAELRPGMYATVRIRLEERPNVLAIPAAAVVRDGGQALVCCVEDDTIARRPVTLGLRSGEQVEVASGLEGGETIVAARAEGLRDGQDVEVIRPAAK